MPRVFKAESLEEVHNRIVSDLIQDPEHTPSPGGKGLVNEFLATTLVIQNPRKRIIMSPARAANYGFAVGELCWYLRGDEDLATMEYYNKRMPAFSDDGKTLRSAYGKRVFNEMIMKKSQFELVVDELMKDPDSRRATVHINEPYDLYVATTTGTKDVPCTMTMQFFIREKKLYLHVLMRSNDVIWGLPYDVFSFTMFQEAMLGILNAKGMELTLGEYYHTAGSIHLYERHFDMARKISDEEDAIFEITMEPISLIELNELIMLEEKIRAGEFDRQVAEQGAAPICSSSIMWMVQQLMIHRNKRMTDKVV